MFWNPKIGPTSLKLNIETAYKVRNISKFNNIKNRFSNSSKPLNELMS